MVEKYRVLTSRVQSYLAKFACVHSKLGRVVSPAIIIVDGKDYGFEFDFTRIQRSTKNTSHHESSMKIFSKASFGISNALIDLQKFKEARKIQVTMIFHCTWKYSPRQVLVILIH